ncbi:MULTISPECIES: CcdB family protein [Xanthomonas]|uniref:Toxin CcdB n=1 Tax=Xanthomonas axonopodis pv. melhusii TaxID=487834 RepID=A0A1T1NTR2_9XANT|nr:CcdB family protein [Xanthomonas axonopodis]OOW66788.1 hypothetical protein Xmlh_18500 [Xanthomonas axonopodis pv. melhusii]
MAQFDVHEYGGKAKNTYPYMMIVQSSDFNASPRRVVVPLVEKAKFGIIKDSKLNPVIAIGGIQLVLQPLEIAAIDTGKLGSLFGNAKAATREIVDCLDYLFTTAFD